MSFVRLTFSGTRQIALVQTAQVLEFMQVQNFSAAKLRDVFGWLESMTPEHARKFANSNPIFCGTVGPNDALFIPAGWCYYEKVGSDDVAGIRCSFLFSVDMDPLEKMREYFKKIGKPNQVLQQALDLLVLSA